MIIEALVIHLARATGRRSQVERTLARLPFKARILDAVDGTALPPEERAEVYVRHLHDPLYPFVLQSGEIGCFLSHRRAWQEIVRNGLDAGLIVEDDVEIDPATFGPALDAASKHIDELGYIQFQVRPAPKRAHVLYEEKNAQLVRPLVTPLRTSAQLVGKSAAARLLAATTRFDRPIDTLLQMHWITGVRLACVVPSGVTDRSAESGGSTMAQKTASIGNRIRREIRRVLYRRRITDCSRRLKPNG